MPIFIALAIFASVAYSSGLAIERNVETVQTTQAPSWCEKSQFGASRSDKDQCGW